MMKKDQCTLLDFGLDQIYVIEQFIVLSTQHTKHMAVIINSDRDAWPLNGSTRVCFQGHWDCNVVYIRAYCIDVQEQTFHYCASKNENSKSFQSKSYHHRIMRSAVPPERHCCLVVPS